MNIARTFNGTGATVYIGLGFVPDWVKLTNMESTLGWRIEWSRQMRAAACEGLSLKGTDHATTPAVNGALIVSRLSFGGGVAPFFGTTLATASSAYLRPHANPDFKDQGTLGRITDWTLDTLANRTGKLNAGVPTTYVGVGSRIRIQETGTGKIKTALVTAMTNDGDATDELTLNLAIRSGKVLSLGPMYDFVGGAAGDKIPEGIIITNNTFNASGEIILIEAGTYDD